jgi:hypothetical protein
VKDRVHPSSPLARGQLISGHLLDGPSR